MILGCAIALKCNPTWVLGEFDLKNAHTDCSRGLIEQEFDSDVCFHFLIQIFLYMYGENCIPQSHVGNGPDQPPTSIHLSEDDRSQGETTPNVFFNILAARLYKAFIKILDGR